MARIELTVPDIGDVHDAAVIELLVQPGATIKAEQSLITIGPTRPPWGAVPHAGC